MNVLRFTSYPVRTALVAILCYPVLAQVVKPADPIVRAGAQVRFTANVPVKWSLAPGSVGTIDADGTYHAPRNIPAPHSMGGCQIGAPDSVFNTRIDNLPVHRNSAEWMAVLPKRGIGLSPSWGTNVVDNTTPAQVMNFVYSTAYSGQKWQIPEWPNLNRESGVFSDPHSGVDRHVLTVNAQSCHVYELYNDYPAGTQASYGYPLANANSGWQYDSVSYALPTHGATDASGMPLAPTTLHLDDIRSGVIRHAMRVTFSNSYIAPRFVWPATTNAGAWGTVPYGTRLRLKSDFDISGFSPTARIILTGLKQYGMIISDGGSNWDIVTSTDVTEDRTIQAAVLEILNKSNLLTSSQIEIVDESSLMVSPSSARIAHNNRYVTPAAFAIVSADDGIHPPVNVPIALQGISLNSPQGGGVWIQSGLSRQLAVFSGNSDSAVSWQMNPVLGTLDAASGLYTAPSVKAPTTTTITATSVADPAVSIKFPLTVMPPGAIRIVAGDATTKAGAPNSHAPDYGPDSQGNMWWRDQAVERAWGVKNDYKDDAFWPSVPDIYRYETQYYNFGDTIYRFLVPNGNYRIDYYVAQGGCGPSNTYDQLLYREHLESQGQIAIHDFRALEAAGGKCDTPVHAAIPAHVTDNSLYFALRRIGDSTKTGQDAAPATTISAFSITPVTDPPHLTIDPATSTAVTMAQSVQLHAVGWYMSNRVLWTLESGPGTLDANGVYTAPSKPVAGTTVIKATSTADPSKFAVTELRLVPGKLTLTPDSITLNRGATQLMTASIAGHRYANVTWSVSSGGGTINAAGMYTAPDALARDTVVTVTATGVDERSLTASATMTVRATVPTIRINCGDMGFTDAQGNVWAADYNYSQPSKGYNTTGVTIARTTPDMNRLYISSRYVYEKERFEYNFPLPNGDYKVTLKFADYSFDAPGFYFFDVDLNGVNVLRNFDPDSVFGAAKTAADKTFVTKVEGKNLRIAFYARKGGALVNGIQIEPLP